MSLFGDSPPGRSRSSLFADPGFDDSAPSTWPSRRPASVEVVRTLLTSENADLPNIYTFFYDSFATQFRSGDGMGVSADGVRRLLDESEVDDENMERIWSIVMKGGKESIGRDEFNVLLAFVGLAQEGDEVTIDGVDDRRKDLPIPTLSGSRYPHMQVIETPTASDASSYNQSALPPAHHAQEHPSPSTPIKVVHRQQSTPISTAPTRPRNTATLFGTESDPWGSPVMHVNHDHGDEPVNPGTVVGNIRQPTPPMERDSSFDYTPSASTLGMPPTESARTYPHHPQQHPPQIGDDEDEPDDIHSALRQGDASRTSSWGRPDSFGGNTYTQPAAFGEQVNPSIVQRHGSFGGLGGNNVNGSGPATDGAGFGRMRIPRGPEETITVNVLPEKEGMFMFQHRNYQIGSSRRGSRVVRRYSDFVWLLDCLHKRYPFRQLPLLPPKRLAVNGHYLSADAAFLESRRRGLSRFANALVRHPVLSQEQLTVMFLTVPTELSVWRRQANLSMQEEFAGKPLPHGLEESLPQNLEQTFDTVRSGLRKSSEIYIQLCNLLQRLEKRQEGIAGDYMRFSGALRALTDVTEATYAVDTNEIPLLNNGLSAVAKHLSQSQSLIEDEVKAWDQGVLEDLKRQRDCLVSMKELFDRKERYATDNIPQLQRRIKQNETKLEMLRNRTDVKPGEKEKLAEKLAESITRDKQSIVDQHARLVLVKECVRDELVFFQNSQYHVSRLHQDWSQERVKYSELQADNWRALCNEVEAMPLGEVGSRFGGEYDIVVIQLEEAHRNKGINIYYSGEALHSGDTSPLPSTDSPPIVMRFSDVRSKAYQVFDFDFLAGNDGLQHQLVELSTDAQSNGDVEFSFPDGTRKRAYTPLFFIAAQNRLPELFGTVDSSGSMPVVHVTVDLEAEVLAALQACYESRTLENLWSAMGCAEYQLASKSATFVAPSPQCDLPPSVAPDFTIQLKSPRARDPIFSIKVHRFLLPIRLSYFRAKFSSRFMDSGAPTATFHTEEFTPFSMWCVASYVYQAKPWEFFSGFAQLRAYIGDSPSGPHWTPTCASFGDAEVPPKEIADRLIEIVLSADFLGVECLVNWAHYSLARFAHEFSCRGRGCSTIVPYVMDLVANNEFSDRWLFEKGIQSFSDRRSICMWKRPLLMCKNPAVVDTLLERVKESMCNAEWTVEYFMRVEEVGRKTAMSDKKAEWAERIINPLLDHAAQCTANSFDQPAVVKSIANVLSSVNPSRPTIEAFLEKVVRNETIKANNCQKVLYGIRMLEKLLGTTKVQGVRDAKDRCINWFRRNYISLSVLPAPDGFEGNFFSTWNSHELDSLLEQMPQEAAEVIRPHSKVLNSYPVSENYRPVKSKFPKQSRGKAEKRGEGERERRQDSNLSVSDAGADIGSDAPPDALNLLLGEDGSSIF